jgi:hypothetical protein
MPADPRAVEPVTAYDAAGRLDKAASTIHLWALRYGARKLGKQGRKVYYDLSDLKVIERELRHGHQVPATPEERAAIADCCPLWRQEQAESARAA